MPLGEGKILCKPPISILDYLGNNNFEWGIKFKICLYHREHLDCIVRRLLLLRAAYCFRLGSAGKVQATLSLVCGPSTQWDLKVQTG